MVESLHRRAAAAELAAGDHPAAVRHLLAVGDHEAAFELVFGPVWDFYRSGSMRELSMWLDQFPPDFVGTDPRRIIRFATTLSLVGRLDDAAMWNDRAGALVAEPTTARPVTIDLALSRAAGPPRAWRHRRRTGGSAAARAIPWAAVAISDDPEARSPNTSWPSPL